MTAPALARAALALTCCAGLAAPLVAQSGFTDVLPGDTLAWAAIDDLEGALDGTLATQSYKVLMDPAFDALRAELAQGFTGMSDHYETVLGVNLLELLGHVEGGAAVALLHLRSRSIEGLPPDLAWTLLLDLKEGAGDDVLTALDELAELAVEDSEGRLVLKFEERAGVQASLLVELNDSEEVVTVSYAVDQDVLVIVQEFGAAQDELHLETLLLGVAGELDETLAEAPEFAAAGFVDQGAPARARLWADLGQLMLLGPVSEGSGDVQVPFGLDALGNFVIESSASADGLLQDMSLHWDQGLDAAELVAAARGDNDPVALAWMPADVDLGAAAELDIAALADAWLSSISAQSPELAVALISGMNDLEAEFGFHPRDDVIEALNGQYGLFLREPEGGLDPNDVFGLIDSVAFCAGLDDASLLGEFFDAVIRSQGLHVARKRDIFEGFEVFALPVFPGIELFYSLGGDVLTLSTSGELVRDVLRRLGNPELASLAKEPSVVAARERLPQASSVLFAATAASTVESLVDWPRGAASAMSMVTDEIPSVPWGDGDISLDALIVRLVELMPPRELVRQRVQGYSLVSLELTDGGIEVRSYAP
ncbi:MAG: hypothetical protein DHS20C15_09910 [Planctomycetota bacterium]|nr:MAG: hypothetical protein DHS20C15_09910 [Planctomycetota bacterium]